MNVKIIGRKASIFFLVALIILELFSVCFSVPSSAASSSYSGVLDDLKKDPKFDASKYPVNNENYTLEIISIAEGTNGELFIYVYQPCVTRELRATYINMSNFHPLDGNAIYDLYSLTWINSDGVFAKYLVNNFKVFQQENRYYLIAGIYRAFNAEIDTPAAEADDVKNHVAFPVGLKWYAYTYNDVVFYECFKLKYADAEILAVGFVRYSEGFKLHISKCDSHFVAFKVNNFDVEKIYDATIRYKTEKRREYGAFMPDDLDEILETSEVKQEISSMETGSNKGNGFLGKKYTWQRILTTEEFNTQLTEFKNEGVTFNNGGLENSQFVFQFLETDYDMSASGINVTTEFTKVTEVGILRLHFVDKAGNQYNLGAVSDLVSDDGNPDFEVDAGDNIENLLEDFKKMLKDFWAKLLPLLGGIIALLIIIFFFGPILTVVKIVFTVIKFILSLLFWVISLPFKLISWLLKPK